MNIFRDKQIKHFSLFIAIYSILLVGVSTWFSINQLNTAKSMYLEHDRAIVSALLEQEVSKEVIANAISSTDISTAGMEFLDNLGITTNTFGSLLPHFSQFQYHFLRIALGGGICLVIILVIGVISFLQIRNNLYRQSGKIIDNYINNDYSCHLPQDSEGDLFHLFASVEQLATMLKAKSETEHKTKEFLKSTISDISHQLKTPLAALMMYQEIIEAEPDNTETVKKFSQKTGTALKRIEQLILSMLKIARLDTGNILFDKRTCLIQELVKNAISELTIRATQEKKQIIVNGTSNQVIMCDMDWTSEAIGNLVKNALDHTINLGVAAKMKEYGSMRAIGMSNRQLIKMIIAEAGTYAISGVIWGCIIGLPMHWVIYVSLITNIWGTAWSVPFIPLILIIAIVLLTSLLAVKGPAKRLQRMSIVENISAQ